MVTLTPKAATHVKTLIERQKMPPETALRLVIKSGGCSGYSYVLDFDPKGGSTEKDNVYDNFGVKTVVDRKSEELIEGMIVDYQDGLRGQGFVFVNPKAKGTCGCGQSFSA